MKKILLFVSFVLFAHIGFSQYITGIDNADNYSQNDYPSEGNLGTGFGLWTSGNTDGGWFLGDATNNGASNSTILNTNGKAFGMWATNFSDVGRNFSSLNTGDKLSFSFSFQWDNGNKGFDIYTGGVGTGQVFNLNLNSAGYTWTNGGSQTMTSWDVAPGDRQHGVVISVVITQTATGLDYNIQASAGDEGFGTKTGSIAFSGNINAIKFYVSGAGGDGGNLYFNNLQIEVADPANVASTANVKINGNVDLATDESLTCNDLTISGSNSLTVKSDATGTGSLIVNGSITGDVTVERYISQYTGDDDGWHLISSPIDNFSVSGSDFDPTSVTGDLYYYDESNDIWKNYESSAFNFVKEKGYLCAYAADDTKEFSGTINNSDVSISGLTLTVGGNGTDDGWNLVGNPFSSALVWNKTAGGWGLSNVATTAKVYNEAGGNYTDVATDGIIPAMNGFFVQVTSGTGSFTIPATSREHSSTAWYKGSESIETVLLKVSGGSNSFYDITRVSFNSNASDSYDTEHDSHKLFGRTSAPQLFTRLEEELFSTNTFASSADERSLDLDFIPGTSGEYTLEIVDNQLESGASVYLEDTFENQMIDLNVNPSYTFNAEVGDNENRFKLHFGATGIEEVQKEILQAYVSGNQLYILGEEGIADLKIYNLQAQELYSETIELTSDFSQSLNFNTGVYIISLQTKEKIKTAKVMIK